MQNIAENDHQDLPSSNKKDEQAINDKYHKKGFSIEDFVKKEPHSFRKNYNLNNLKPEKSQLSSKTATVATKNIDNNMWKDWWRWLLMPFISVGGAYIGFFIFMLIQYINPANTDGYLNMITLIIIPVVGKAIFGFIIGLLSYTIAPRGKMISSVVMITLVAIITIMDMLLSWYNLNYSLAIKVQVLIGTIALITGAVYGVKQAEKDN